MGVNARSISLACIGLMLLAASPAAHAAKSCEGHAALRKAAVDGSAAAVRSLLDAGVPPDPSRECPYHRTALDIAAERGHLNVVRILAARGGRLFYASMYAVGQRDDPALVAAIVEAAPEDRRAALINDALGAACQKGRIQVVRYLLEAGADPNTGYPRTGGEAPLLAAASAKNHELLLLLLEAGAEPTAAALRSAVAAGNVEAARVLLDGGADPFLADTSGNALSVAAASSRPARSADYDAIGALLLERGVDPNLHHRGKLPLSWARENENEALAQRLRDSGARAGTTTAYKLRRVKKSIQSAAYVVVLFLGGGH